MSDKPIKTLIPILKQKWQEQEDLRLEHNTQIKTLAPYKRQAYSQEWNRRNLTLCHELNYIKRKLRNIDMVTQPIDEKEDGYSEKIKYPLSSVDDDDKLIYLFSVRDKLVARLKAEGLDSTKQGNALLWDASDKISAHKKSAQGRV